LWERVVQDIEANAPWQRLRRNLLLLLQLLFLLLLIFGLARPFMTTDGVAGESLIVVLDNSISMGANDGQAGTRLDDARAEALRLMEGLPDHGEVTVIRGGDGADILVANSDDPIAVRAALAEVEAVAYDSDLASALTLAAAVAARQADSEIVILSDGAVELPNTLAIDRPIRYLPLGTTANNQAISVLNLTRNAEGYDLFVQVTNYGPEAITRRLLIELDESLFTASDLTIPAGEQTAKIFAIARRDSFRIKAQLEGQDGLAADDVAYAVPGPSGKRKVRLMSPSPVNRFLSVPFMILPEVEFSQGHVISDSLDANASGERADLLILDRWLPAEGLPGSTENLLIVAPPAGNDMIHTTGVITAPVPLKSGSLPAIEENLFFEGEGDLFFVEARLGTVPSWGIKVLQDASTGAPLLWVGEQNGRRIAVLNLAIYGQPESIPLDPPRDVVLTNLVYQPAYPVLMASLANYLLVGPAGGLAGQSLAVGELIQLPLLDASSLQLLPPSGQAIEAERNDARTASYQPTTAGIYTVKWLDSEQPPIQFTVNLFAPHESNITPIPELALTSSSFGRNNTQVASSGLTGQAQQEFWRPLLLIGLLILLIEWMLYQKDALVRLRKMMG
jgi:hypothetical protein